MPQTAHYPQHMSFSTALCSRQLSAASNSTPKSRHEIHAEIIGESGHHRVCDECEMNVCEADTKLYGFEELKSWKCDTSNCDDGV